jgi:hypothetical protein
LNLIYDREQARGAEPPYDQRPNRGAMVLWVPNQSNRPASKERCEVSSPRNGEKAGKVSSNCFAIPNETVGARPSSSFTNSVAKPPSLKRVLHRRVQERCAVLLVQWGGQDLSPLWSACLLGREPCFPCLAKPKVPATDRQLGLST